MHWTHLRLSKGQDYAIKTVAFISKIKGPVYFVQVCMYCFHHILWNNLNQDMLYNMTETEFNKHVSALATKRLEKPKKLLQQNNKYWTEIISSFYNFDRGGDMCYIKLFGHYYVYLLNK